MTLPKPKVPAPFRRAGRNPAGETARPPAAAAEEAPPKPAHESGGEHGASEPVDIGWRASSYDLKQGLDVVELPTSLPQDVLDRLFNAPRR